MNDPENFLTRWSRRKQDAVKDDSELEPERDEKAAPTEGEKEAVGEDKNKSRMAAVPKGDAAEPVFDLSQLPPIETITAATDIRPFLAPGVPGELTRAALRRAWVADPAIRDYIGLSENAWDFNDPHAALGFDLSSPTGDQLKRLLADVLGGGKPEEKTETPHADANAQLSAPAAEESPVAAIRTTPPSSHDKLKYESESRDATEEKPVADQPPVAEHNERSAAPQHEDRVREANLPAQKRSHGRALPQ